MRVFLILLLSSLSTISFSQTAVSIELMESYSPSEVSSIIVVASDFPVDVYRVLYLSQEQSGTQDTLSGLMTIPVGSSRARPLVIYQHGTVDNRFTVPSEMQGGWEAGLIFSANGFISLLPDYVGMGVSEGLHPYIHAETEATAALDMLRAVEDFLNIAYNDIYNEQIFLTGYSQGGHAVQALHRIMQEDFQEEFNLVAAVHASGPYDISGVMADLILGNMVYGYPGFIPFIVMSYNMMYEIDYTVEEIFKEPYIEDIQSFLDEEIGLFTLNSRLISTLSAEVGASIPSALFEDSLLNALSEDENHPLNQALKNNNTYHWAPEVPTELHYCTGDLIVPYENSLVAEDTMMALGSESVVAINLGPWDHGTCAIFSIQRTLNLFNSLVFLSVSQPKYEKLAVYPIPVDDRMYWPSTLNLKSIEVFSLTGRKLFSASGPFPGHSLDLQRLESGIYLLTATGRTGEKYRSRFIKN